MLGMDQISIIVDNDSRTILAFNCVNIDINKLIEEHQFVGRFDSFR